MTTKHWKKYLDNFVSKLKQYESYATTMTEHIESLIPEIDYDDSEINKLKYGMKLKNLKKNNLRSIIDSDDFFSFIDTLQDKSKALFLLIVKNDLPKLIYCFENYDLENHVLLSLKLAIYYERYEILCYLLENNDDIITSDTIDEHSWLSYKENMLHMIMMCMRRKTNDLRIIKKLFDHYTDKCIIISCAIMWNLYDVFNVLIDNYHDISEFINLIFCVGRKYLELVIKKEYNIEPYINNSCLCACLYCRYPNEESKLFIIKFLIENGIDLTTLSQEEKMDIIRYSSSNIMKMLFEYGLELSELSEMPIKDKVYIIKHSSFDTLKLLIEHGIDFTMDMNDDYSDCRTVFCGSKFGCSLVNLDNEFFNILSRFDIDMERLLLAIIELESFPLRKRLSFYMEPNKYDKQIKQKIIQRLSEHKNLITSDPHFDCYNLKIGFNEIFYFNDFETLFMETSHKEDLICGLVIYGCFDILPQYLEHCPDIDYKTLLILSVYCKRYDIINYLLENYVSDASFDDNILINTFVNCPDSVPPGSMSLSNSMMPQGKFEMNIIEKLIEYGADLKNTDHYPMIELLRSKKCFEDDIAYLLEKYYTEIPDVLATIISYEYRDLYIDLLTQNKIKVNNDVLITKLLRFGTSIAPLFEFGIDFSQISDTDKLCIISKCSNTNLKILIDHGVDLSLDIPDEYINKEYQQKLDILSDFYFDRIKLLTAIIKN